MKLKTSPGVGRTRLAIIFPPRRRFRASHNGPAAIDTIVEIREHLTACDSSHHLIAQDGIVEDENHLTVEFGQEARAGREAGHQLFI